MSRAARARQALLACVLAACSDDGAADGSSRGGEALAERAVLRLGTDLPPVARGQRPVARPFAAAVEDLLAPAVPRYAVVEDAEGRFGFQPAPAAAAVVLRRGEGVALALSVEAGGGVGLAVELAVRAEGAPSSGELPVAAVVELTRPFDPAAPLSRQQVLDLFDARKRASHVLAVSVGAEAVVLRAEFVTDPSTRACVIYLLAPLGDPDRSPSALAFPSLGLQRLASADLAASGVAVPRVTPLALADLPEAVAVELDREERKALALVPPAQLAFELPAASGPRLLELALGVLPGGGAGEVRFSVRADERELFAETRAAPRSVDEPAWADRRIELPGHAHRLVLATEALGQDPPLAYMGHPTVLREGADERPHVVLISLDTLRPDRLGCYGARPSWSPRLDALAAEGLRFTQAYSTSSYTLPSHASLLTGQYPAFHGAVDVSDAIDPQHSPLLAATLARAGWLTAAFTGGGYVATRYGFGEGFDRYSHNDPVWALDTLRGRQLMETMSWERVPIRRELLARYDGAAVARWISAHADGPPFFLFLHTYVVHNYAPDRAGLLAAGLLADGDPSFNHRQREAFNAGEQGLGDTVRGQYLPFYDATIGMADAFVGQVLDALEAGGIAGRTLVVVTSDHGEEFGEHGFFGHGESLSEEVTSIPLIARLPGGQRATGVLDDPVSLVDLAPWILSVLDLPRDPRMGDAPPLGPARLAPPARQHLVLELDNHRYRMSAVRDGELKLTVDLGRDGRDFEEPRQVLHDLSAGAAGLVDLAPARPADVARLREQLAAFHRLAGLARPRDGGRIELSEIDPEELRQLQALGYLQGLEGDEEPRR